MARHPEAGLEVGMLGFVSGNKGVDSSRFLIFADEGACAFERKEDLRVFLRETGVLDPRVEIVNSVGSLEWRLKYTQSYPRGMFQLPRVVAVFPYVQTAGSIRELCNSLGIPLVAFDKNPSKERFLEEVMRAYFLSEQSW